MYALDTKAARKADATGNFIKEIGKYVGTFSQAEDIKAKTGTRGIALTFVNEAGQKANLSLYTEKENGDRLMGFDTLMAVMTCMGLRNIEPKPGKVIFWNSETKAEETRTGTVFPELHGKKVGLLLETEDYPRNDGGVGTRMVLKSVFQADTELTASEILDRKTKPEQLASQVAGLRHRPMRAAQAAAAPAPAKTNAGSGFEDMDDDVPF